MNRIDKDSGLQKERTSMSWLRTALVLFGVSLLLIKVGKTSITLTIVGSLLILIAIVISINIKKRFIHPFYIQGTVGYKELVIKKLLSLTIFIASIVYIIYMINNIFNIHFTS